MPLASPLMSRLMRRAPILPRLIVLLLIVLMAISTIFFLFGRTVLSWILSPASLGVGFWNVLLFVCQMVLLASAVCLIPALGLRVLGRGNYLVRVIVESGAFVAVFIGFGFWLFGTPAFGMWILYAVGLVLFIEVGSNLVEWRKDVTLKRLKDNTLYKSIVADIERMARYEIAFYISIPFGLIIGVIIGLIRHRTYLQITEICVQVVLLLAALVLLCFLVVGFLRMSNPLAKRLTESAQQGSQEDQDKQYIDLVCDATALRTLYKYDALHNTILLVVFILVVIKIQLFPIGLPWLIISLLLGTLVFSETPYAIGQYLLRDKILGKYTGGKHVKMAKELRENAPVLPPLPILRSFLASGTAGGFLYALLISPIVQNMFTTLNK